SGLAREAELRYYRCRRRNGLINESAKNMATAIEAAVEDGADIINISYGWRQNCDRTYDRGGMNAVISAATASGTLIVAAAGNQGNTLGGCSVDWPASNRNVLSVAGVGSRDSSTRGRTNYGAAGVATESSAGSQDVIV